MRDLSLIMAYYENAGMLHRQYANLLSMPKELRKHVTLILVDDGSPEHPAFTGKVAPAGLKLFRMLVDIPWNQDACRNLAVHHASPGWMILTDMDHLVPLETLEFCLTAELDEKLVYRFARKSEPSMAPYKVHPNSFLMTKTIYDRAGGYDERFAGIYGTDGRFRGQLNMITEIHDLSVPIIRVPREVTPDASTTRYSRQSQEYQDMKVRVREQIKKSGDLKPRRLTFPWEQVA